MDFETLLSAYLTWDYDTLMSTFGAPGTWPPPRPVPAQPARALHDCMAPLAEHAIWARTPNAVLAKLGLPFGPAYVWSRGAYLGEPPAEVVAAAFAVFNPRLVVPIYEAGRRQCGRAGLLAARQEATIASLEEILGDVDVRPTVAVLRRGLDAADGAGRPVFCGLRALGWPDSPVGQLWRACELIREHRGDSHVAAWISAGLSPVAVNLLTELWLGMPFGAYTAMRRGWSEEEIGVARADMEARGLVAGTEITAAGRRLRDDIEDRTDAMQQPIVDAIGDDLDGTIEALDGWSSACAEAGAFPPGTYVRLAA